MALGLTDAFVEPQLGPGIASLAGALAFAICVVFLVVGPSKFFTENFFDPVAATMGAQGPRPWLRLIRLWMSILALVGGALMVSLLSVDGALPAGSAEALSSIAEDVGTKGWQGILVRAVLAGALITLLSYLLNGVDSVGARIAVSTWWAYSWPSDRLVMWWCQRCTCSSGCGTATRHATWHWPRISGFPPSAPAAHHVDTHRTCPQRLGGADAVPGPLTCACPVRDTGSG